MQDKLIHQLPQPRLLVLAFFIAGMVGAKAHGAEGGGKEVQNLQQPFEMRTDLQQARQAINSAYRENQGIQRSLEWVRSSLPSNTPWSIRQEINSSLQRSFVISNELVRAAQALREPEAKAANDEWQ